MTDHDHRLIALLRDMAGIHGKDDKPDAEQTQSLVWLCDLAEREAARADAAEARARACVEAARAAYNAAGDEPSRGNPPGYDVAAMQAGAAIVLNAVERAAVAPADPPRRAP